MHYVMSDLHGTYIKFKQMLQKIQFNKEEDELYILGDIVDRGLDVAKCIKWVKENLDNKSVYMTLGNHDWEWKETVDNIKKKRKLQNLEDTKDYCDEILNGSEMLNLEEFEYFYNLVSTLPLYYDIKVDDRRFILAHAGVNIKKIKNTDINMATWSRGEFYKGEGVKGATIIFGHTPTDLIKSKLYKAKNEGSTASIKYRKDGCMIAIDCGAVFRGGRLGCLRLEDGKEFYI